MVDATFEDVADTASWVAAYRAKESARADALFRDPLAERVTDDRGRLVAEQIVGAESFAWMIAVRTTVLDALILAAVASGVDAVLNLGAGMDTRPYRLALPPGLRWYEVDQAKIIGRKEERLRGEVPLCDLRRVGMDLAQIDERRRFFAEVSGASRRVLVVAEGVIGYLRNDEVGALADDLADHPAFTEWIVDYASPMLRKAMARRRTVRRQFRAAPLRFDPPDWEGFFARRGWSVRAMHFFVEEGQRRGRPMPMPLWLRLVAPISRSMREQLRRMMGFAVLEQAPPPPSR